MRRQIPLTPGAVALTRVLADPGHRRLADHRLTERLLQQRLDVAHRQAPQEPDDDQCLQRVRAGDALAEHPALESQPLRVADPRTLELHRTARRLDRPGFVAVAIARRARDIIGALIALATEELGHLLLECLLQDQPRTQPRDRLDRIVVLTDPGQHRIEWRRNRSLGTILAMRAYLHRFDLSGQKRRLRPHEHFPGQRDATRNPTLLP